MRIAILSNTLPAALPIYDELKRNSDVELFIVLCPVSRDSGARDFGRHFARWILKEGRWESLRLALAGRVLVCRKALDHPRTRRLLSSLKLDIGLHKSGTIYHASTIACFRLGILNAHIGILPRYRGRSVMEWALIEGGPVGVTVFFIDAGIDTGTRILMSEEVDVSQCKSIAEAKQYLFSLDAVFYRRAVELLYDGTGDCHVNDGSGRRYYIMSRLFHDVAENVLPAIENK